MSYIETAYHGDLENSSFRKLQAKTEGAQEVPFRHYNNSVVGTFVSNKPYQAFTW